MSRTLTTATANAVSAADVYPIILARLDFASGVVRLHSHTGSVVFNSETYTGVGSLGVISEIEEVIDDSANALTLTLSAESSIIALCLTEDVRGRPVKLYLGALTSGGSLIADPALIFSGFASHMSHSDNGTTGSVTLHCVDETGDQERPLERRLTNEDQQRLYPGDRGLEYVVDLPNQQFTWGNANVKAATPTGPTDAPVSNENIGSD